MASRLGAASSIIVNCLDPGYCTSELRRKSPKGATPDSNTLAEHTTEEGSRQLVWAAIGGVGRESELRGAYIAISDIEEPSDFVIGDEGAVAQKRVWVSPAICNLVHAAQLIFILARMIRLRSCQRFLAGFLRLWKACSLRYMA